MKSTGVIQVVAVLLLVASAASCEVAKEYSNRVFKPTVPEKKPESTALKFMQFDSGNATDSVDLRDLVKEEMKVDIEESKETEPKEMAKTGIVKDTVRSEVATVETRPVLKDQPVDGTKRNTTRTKRVRQ